MQHLPSSIRYRCGLSTFKSTDPVQWFHAVRLSVLRRHRSGGASTRWERPREFLGGPPARKGFEKPRRWVNRNWPASTDKPQKPFVDPQNIQSFFESDVERWSQSTILQNRLESFGIPKDEVKPLLSAFVSAVKQGQLSTPEGFEKYGLARFVQDLSEYRFLSDVDLIYSTILFTWASDPAHEQLLTRTILPSTVAAIQRLTQAADRSYPAEEYPGTRKMHRTVIMHVGPTNSGKTHHALRALAAAETGVYAGPLRLLAHEIWERLNLGQIVPLGVEEEPVTTVKTVEDVGSALDLGDVAPAVKKLGNPKYVRVCNMVTGEEQKIVEEAAGLLSCTVEMLSFNNPYDVAVIDEIQMISDEQRGSAWTAAVLGVRATEVHLCGELTAVPLIRQLLKDTGDTLIVKEYQRLTPLVVEEASLDGDFSLVRKGDCIVTFRRSSIFAIKRQIEEQTGLRCAVVYGKLPPEIRSEQAALFNDPNSGYDVIIGSDAIGMGLNLKIRRIIFEAVKKWDGGTEKHLSVSQTKQIAGRAGRYGLHGDEKPGGFTTTLNAVDLPFLRKTLDIPPTPLQHARIGPQKESFAKLANILPPGSSTLTIHNAHAYVARLPPTYRYTESSDIVLSTICQFIDTRGASLTIQERLLHMMAPIPWREEALLEIISKFIQMYSDNMSVDLLTALRGTHYMPTMLRIEEKIAAGVPPTASTKVLETLEALHKILVVYIWMSFRNSVAYNSQVDVVALKKRVEVALEWALQGLSTQYNFAPMKDTRSAREAARVIPYDTKADRILRGTPLSKLVKAA